MESNIKDFNLTCALAAVDDVLLETVKAEKKNEVLVEAYKQLAIESEKKFIQEQLKTEFLQSKINTGEKNYQISREEYNKVVRENIKLKNELENKTKLLEEHTEKYLKVLQSFDVKGE